MGPEFKDLTHDQSVDLLEKKLRSRRWRLDNFYKVVDEKGRIVTFRMKFAQKLLFLGFWYCNIVLKSRQHGITTEMCILFLDTCLFNSNMSAAIIAHNNEDAKDFFNKKIKFAYDYLPEWIKNAIRARQDAAGVLSFDNGSSIRVTTSGRSGTYQLIHISEFGKMCAKFPARAEEVITGTLNTIHPGQLVTIESTAEGREGRFYEMVQESIKAQQEDRELSELDFKFHFFGAYENELNRITTPVPIPQRLQKYFEESESILGTKFEDEFKWWYVGKEKTQGELMYREHPLTPEEAFMKSMEGSYYHRQMAQARKDGRIGQYPHRPGIPVHTFWDLGFNEFNAIWFVQKVGGFINVIDYYENSGESLMHYADYLQELREKRGYQYGEWWAPHDIMVHEYTSGKTRLKFAQESGINFQVGSRVAKPTQIEAVRRTLPICRFDLEKCEKGIDRLDNYRKEWNDKLGCWRDRPYEDDNTHGADAFAVMALNLQGVHNFDEGPMVVPQEIQQLDQELSKPEGWT